MAIRVEIVCEGTRPNGERCGKRLGDALNGIEAGVLTLYRRCRHCQHMNVVTFRRFRAHATDVSIAAPG